MKKWKFVWVLGIWLVSFSARANDSIFHCDMKQFRKLTPEVDVQLTLERFLFKITRETVWFGNGGFLHNQRWPIFNWLGKDFWKAGDAYEIFHFSDGTLYFTIMKDGEIYASVSTCTEF